MSEMHWLAELEGKVADAAAQLETLRKANGALERKAKKLEQRLKSAQGDGAAARDWEKERKLIRNRVQRLADNLEALLKDDGEG